MMKIILEENMQLTAHNIDSVIDKIKGIEDRLKLTSKQFIELQYLIDSALNDSRNVLGETTHFQLKIYKRLGREHISLVIAGEQYNPLDAENYDDDYIRTLLDNVTIVPSYSYSAETGNSILLRLPKKHINGVIKTILAITMAFIVSWILSYCPKDLSVKLDESVIGPLMTSYLSLISIGGTLMIFLSLVSGITSMQSVSRLKQTGSLVIKHIMFRNLMIGVGLVVIIPLLLGIIDNNATGTGFAGADIITFILSAIPSNIVEPFQTQNVLQVSVIAIVLGAFLLIYRDRAKTLVKFFYEANLVVLEIFKSVCKLLPIYIFMSFLSLLLNNKISDLKECWVMFALEFVGCLIFLIIAKVISRIKYKVSIMENLKNSIPCGLIGFTTCSSIACLTNNREICLKQYNVDEETLEFSLIIQQIVYKIDMIATYLSFTFGFCWIYDIKFSILSYLSASILIILMGIITPPIPGAPIAVVSSIFVMAGLPAQAIAVFISVNVFTDMLATGTKTLCISDELLAIDRKFRNMKKSNK